MLTQTNMAKKEEETDTDICDQIINGAQNKEIKKIHDQGSC